LVLRDEPVTAGHVGFGLLEVKKLEEVAGSAKELD